MVLQFLVAPFQKLLPAHKEEGGATRRQQKHEMLLLFLSQLNGRKKGKPKKNLQAGTLKKKVTAT